MKCLAIEIVQVKLIPVKSFKNTVFSTSNILQLPRRVEIYKQGRNQITFYQSCEIAKKLKRK